MLRIPTLSDFEAQPTRLNAEVSSMMSQGRVALGENAVYLSANLRVTNALRRRLFDLMAARWVVVQESVEPTLAAFTPQLQLVASDGAVRVYENPQALPRAYWVPQVEVVPPPRQLEWLADGDADLRRVAVLDGPPADGFLGAPLPGVEGRVTFVENDPTHLALRVEAPARGFLFVSDSYYPGWRATVDGRPTPILRADRAFRAVEVPAGTSTVEMRFRPTSVVVGAAIAAVTVVIVAGVLLAPWWRRRGAMPVV